MPDISLDMLTLFQAINSDPAKAKVLEDICAELAKVEAEREALKADRAESEQLRHEAADHRRATQAMLDELHAKSAGVAREQQALAAVRDSMNAEKAAFEAVRTKVDADHDTREKQLAERAAAADERESRIASRENAVGQRESDAARAGEAATRKLAALQAAMAA